MSYKSIALGVALAFPMALMAQSVPMNHSGNNNSQLSHSDQQFLHHIAQEDQSEINLARLALQKSSNSQVRQYAQSKILSADPQMEQQAKTIAQQDHASVNANPNQLQQQEYKTLSRLNGTEFDKAYMRYEARTQGADLNLVKHEINNTSNQQVKSYANNKKTPVWQASQNAETVASNMGQGMSQSSAMNHSGSTPQGSSMR